MQQIVTIQKYLKKLDIHPEATSVYLALWQLGPSSAQQVAKSAGFSRTQTYRRLEELQTPGLVSSERLSYGTLFRALPIENIEATLANRESEIKAIQRNLPAMAQLLQALTGTKASTAQVRHYYGLAGLKQANWNLTKATHSYKVFEAAHLSDHFDKAFARRCRERYIEKQLTGYDLTNATTVTKAELEPYDSMRSHVRHIDPEILRINFEMYMYDNTVTLLDYSADNQHAIEIQHPSLYSMMDQLFDAMWNMATEIPIQ